MAPAKFRGAFNIGFQLAVTVGILTAGLVNYCTEKMEGGWGWRVSLALVGIPATVITCGAMLLPETPNSLIERGYNEKAKVSLQRIRGTPNVIDEFNVLVKASEASKKVEHPWRSILHEPIYRPQLVICIVIPIFQQLTGINVIVFYAPALFRTIGFQEDSSIMSIVISGFVNMLATIVSIKSVDKFGRRILFLEGGVQMILSQVAS